MDIDFISEVMSEALRVMIMSALPILLTGMVVGFIIAILQAATSIQEQTMTFVPKIVAIIIALILFFPWIASNLVSFSTYIFELIPEMAKY